MFPLLTEPKDNLACVLIECAISCKCNTSCRDHSLHSRSCFFLLLTRLRSFDRSLFIRIHTVSRMTQFTLRDENQFIRAVTIVQLVEKDIQSFQSHNQVLKNFIKDYVILNIQYITGLKFCLIAKL